MAINIEMNLKQENGDYMVMYPKADYSNMNGTLDIGNTTGSLDISTRSTGNLDISSRTTGNLNVDRIEGILPVSKGGTGVNNYGGLANIIIPFLPTSSFSVDTGNYVGTYGDIPTDAVTARDAYVTITFPKGRPNLLVIYNNNDVNNIAVFPHANSGLGDGLGFQFGQPLMKIGETHAKAYAARYMTYSWILNIKSQISTSNGIVRPNSNQIMFYCAQSVFQYGTNNSNQTVKPSYGSALFFNWSSSTYYWEAYYY